MNMGWVKTRQTKYGAYLAVYILVVLAILGAANYLAQRYNKTLDATSSKIFSLSDQTKKVIGNLKQDVKIYYFDTASRMNESRFGASPRDLLGRYGNLSHRVTVEFVDPVKNPKKTLDMKVNSAGTTIVEVAGRREEAKSLSEEQLTNALIRALKVDKRTACFIEGAESRWAFQPGGGPPGTPRRRAIGPFTLAGAYESDSLAFSCCGPGRSFGSGCLFGLDPAGGQHKPGRELHQLLHRPGLHFQ